MKTYCVPADINIKVTNHEVTNIIVIDGYHNGKTVFRDKIIKKGGVK